MAASIGYIGSLVHDDKNNMIPSGVPLWDGHKGFVENLVRYPLLDQMRCALDQLLSISYYNVFYGRGYHELVNEYADEVVNDVRGRLLPICAREYKEGVYKIIVDTLDGITKFLKTYQWTDVNIGVVRDFLTTAPYLATPVAWGWGNKNNYMPFLMFMNRCIDPNYQKFEGEVGLVGFTVHGDANGLWVVWPRDYSIGVSFSTKETPMDKGHNVSLLSYLSHFDLSNISFDTIIGIFGDLPIHNDMTRSGINDSMRLASTIRTHIFGIGNISGAVSGFHPFGMSGDNWRMFEVLKNFVTFAHNTYGTVAKDKNAVANLFRCFANTQEQKNTVEYIEKLGGSASADQYQAARESFGAGIEALTFISQRPSLLSAQSQEAGSVVAEDNQGKQEAKPEEKSEADKPKEETQPKQDEKESDKKDEKDSTEKDDTTQDDLGGDDNSDFGDDAEDPSKSDGGDNGNSATPGGDAEPSVDNTPAEEPEVNTSDVTGFEFRSISADSETVDSVLFKEEMSSFLENILANPPDDLKPQDVATLKVLKRHWLHCLSIETIMGIVGNCVRRLPESLIKLNTKLYGVNKQ